MTKRFPIMIGYQGTAGPCPSWIPWDAIAIYEGHAQENHQQSLQRLSERGGLSPVEAYYVMTGRRWKGETFSTEMELEACAFLDNLVKGGVQAKLEAALLRIGDQAKAIKKSLATLESQQAGLQQFYRLEFSKEMKRENKKAK